MNSERWSQIQAMFEAALEQEPLKRVTFLEAACEGDLDLYREVSSLLESDQQINSLLEGQALDAVTYSATQDHPELDLVDNQIGSYRLTRRLGQGGMGIVYLAERIDGQFEQQVALKLIKRGMDTESIVRRFLAERQILAQLQHPNIARLLDGGTTEDDRPYFVMEYIDGIPLLQYCNTKKLGIEKRLDLFEQVCQAIQYAHRNLIIHRDLKPSNILVTKEEQIKLLDFGIARVLEEDGGPQRTLLTEAGTHVLTPEYAAPEQIGGSSITTQTDIYSLGVVLYELLTGLRPLKLTSHSPAEVEIVLRDHRPAKPSARALENERIDVTHGMTAEKISRKLRGDLDTICLKALNKEPERRFSSVDEFSNDIDRHRRGLPVAAQPDSTGYRLRKFVSRHLNGVVTSAAVILLLATVVSLYTVRLSEERNRAQQSATEAQQITAFLTSLLSAANPHVAQGDTLNVRQILDEGGERIKTELSDQPSVQASLLTTVGDAYNGLGLYTRAEEHFDQALQLLKSIGEGETTDAAQLLQNIADIRHSLSDFSAADSFQRATLELQKKIHGEEHPAIAAILLKMASTNRSIGNYDVAIPLYEQAVAMNEKLLPKDDSELAWSINNLGWAYHSSGRYEEAEAAYVKAVQLQRDFLGNDHPDLGFTLNNLGGLLRTTGRFEEGEQLIRESIDIRTGLYGEKHPETMQSLNNLAGLLFTKGDYKAAEPIYRSVYEFNRENLGEYHRYTASTMGSLASVNREKGNLDEAESLQQRALNIYREMFGERHRSVANAQSNMATIYRLQGDSRRAADLYEASLNFWREQETPSIEVAYPLTGLGLTLIDTDPSRAESLLREALQVRTERLGENDLLLAETKAALGRCLALQGKSDEALSLFENALETYRNAGRLEDRRAIEMAGWLKDV